MAQTKRKRHTKHRGNAAGSIEVRGRTGRKPTDSERKTADSKTRAARPNRYDKPPTWIGAARRAGIATSIFVVAVSVATQRVVPTITLGVFMLALYTPLGYYTDHWAYTRRQRKLAEGKLKR